jgi:predicted metal-binding membrane protein
MEAASPTHSMPRGAVRPPLRRSHLALIGLLLVLAIVAWLVTGDRMQGMDEGPGSDLGSLGFYVGAWVVMMAAMMFPSLAPMVLAYARIGTARVPRTGGLAPGHWATFVAGYLVAWTLFGLLAYGLFALGRSLSIDALAWDRGGPYVAGAVLAAAAVYELTPAKNACLTRCRGPFAFLTEAWRDGWTGALRMGAEHGLWCVGCCWALMAALFALGVMSIAWMIFIAALIAAEKLLPWSPGPSRAIAGLLLVLGVAVAVAPESVPGLTLPGAMM